MKINANSALEFFNEIPDNVLSRIAAYDWETLKVLCLALTLDLQILEEKGLAV